MSNDEIIQALQATKERLFEKGWMKGDIGDPVTGPNCLVGAIHVVSGYNWLSAHENRKSGEKSRAVITALQDASGIPPVIFNDREAKNFDDIIDYLDLAIKKLEGV